MPASSRIKRSASIAALDNSPLSSDTNTNTSANTSESSNKTRLIILDDSPNTTALGKLLSVVKPNPEQYMITLPAGSKNKCDTSKLSPSDLLSRPAELVIKTASASGFLVKNQEGQEWNLAAELVSSQCWSPDQYTKIVKVTMTEMVTMLKEKVGDCICKVEFTKLPDSAEMSKLIREGAKLIEQTSNSEKDKIGMFKKLYERSQMGEYRVMRGYIYRSENQEAQETETGMLQFVDAELRAQGKYAIRPINLRNIEALTFKLTRYELK